MNLKALRNERKLTQEKVAKDNNIGRASYNRYELGATDPDIETLKRLADYFHTTIDSIVGHEVPYLLDKGILSNEQNMLVDQIIKLTPRQCELVSTYIIGLLAAEQDKQNILNKINKGE